MTNEEIVSGYKKIIDDQAAIIKGYVELVNGYEQQLKIKQPSFVQGLLGREMLECLRKDSDEALELDPLKLSDEERRERFGIRIRMLRKFLGLTQADLAKKIGLKPQVVALYEAGKQEPNPKNLIGLSRALNTTTDWLLGELPPQLQ